LEQNRGEGAILLVHNSFCEIDLEWYRIHRVSCPYAMSKYLK